MGNCYTFLGVSGRLWKSRKTSEELLKSLNFSVILKISFMHKSIINLFLGENIKNAFLKKIPTDMKYAVESLLLRIKSELKFKVELFETDSVIGLHYAEYLGRGRYLDVINPTPTPRIIVVSVDSDLNFLIKGEKPIHLLDLNTNNIDEVTTCINEKWKELEKYNLRVLAYRPKEKKFLSQVNQKEIIRIIKTLAFIRNSCNSIDDDDDNTYALNEQEKYINFIYKGRYIKPKIFCTIMKRDGELILTTGPNDVIKFSNLNFRELTKFLMRRQKEVGFWDLHKEEESAYENLGPYNNYGYTEQDKEDYRNYGYYVSKDQKTFYSWATYDDYCC